MKTTNNRGALCVRQALSLLGVLLLLNGVTPGAFADVNEGPEHWVANGKAKLDQMLARKHNTRRAKNIIFFLGDGMDIPTVVAAHILEGQMRGETGEENYLSFERWPYVGLAKVYNTNAQTPDSAGTMTSMMTGVKTRQGVLGIDADSNRGDHTTVQRDRLTTIMEQAEHMGKSTGVVSSARVTHATPAACYAKSADRNWEDDDDLPDAAAAAGVKDIARQAIEWPWGNGLEVLLGGGRRHFLPMTEDDPEDAGSTGNRADGRNLMDEWAGRGQTWEAVWNQAQFDAIDPASTDHLLGLFERSHVEYEYDRPGDTGGEPSLTEMTEKAIEILSKNANGFFLMVESGRIDHAHHATNAYRSLTDTIEFAEAIARADEMTSDDDTLLIVTADHGHVFNIGGYPVRGNPIMGLTLENDSTGEPKADVQTDDLGLPYTTLTYGNGPGYREGGRTTVTEEEASDPEYLQETTIPLGSETHSGQDVGVWAKGPWAHLIDGNFEQSYLYYVQAYAFGLR